MATFRDGNPYARRAPSILQLLRQAMPFSYAQEGPQANRLHWKPRKIRTVPPILDERPLDIYRTTTLIYRSGYRIPRIYVSEPEQIPGG